METNKLLEMEDEALDAAAVSGGVKRTGGALRTDICSVCGVVSPVLKNGAYYCPNCGKKLS